MIEVAVYVLIGVFVGWNFPQPAYAKFVQDKVTTWFKETFLNRS